jgi:phosphoglycerate dehydrogenase-like enzyme
MPTVCLPTEDAAAGVGELPPDVRIVVWDGAGSPPADFADVEFFVADYMGGPVEPAVLAGAPRLAIVQLMSAGVEPWLGGVPPGVVLCAGRGVHGASTAELAVGGLLAVQRELPRFLAAQREHRWAPHQTSDLNGAGVLIVGAGDIGRRVATSVAAFGAEATLVGRSARDGVRGRDELPALLRGQAAVVLAVPLTPDTRGLVDAALLAALDDGAILVNVARGALVDTGALLAELTAGRLRAFLDVVDPEPLPADHPLWDAPNVVLTPHVGGGTRGWQRRAYALVREQILRWHSGEPLANVVASGY